MASKSIYTMDPEEYSEHGFYVTAGSFEQAERKKPMVVQALELESRLEFQAHSAYKWVFFFPLFMIGVGKSYDQQWTSCSIAYFTLAKYHSLSFQSSTLFGYFTSLFPRWYEYLRK